MDILEKFFSLKLILTETLFAPKCDSHLVNADVTLCKLGGS